METSECIFLLREGVWQKEGEANGHETQKERASAWRGQIKVTRKEMNAQGEDLE